MKHAGYFLFVFLLLQYVVAAQGQVVRIKMFEVRLKMVKEAIAPLELEKSQAKQLEDYFKRNEKQRKEYKKRYAGQGDSLLYYEKSWRKEELHVLKGVLTGEQYEALLRSREKLYAKQKIGFEQRMGREKKIAPPAHVCLYYSSSKKPLGEVIAALQMGEKQDTLMDEQREAGERVLNLRMVEKYPLSCDTIKAKVGETVWWGARLENGVDIGVRVLQNGRLIATKRIPRQGVLAVSVEVQEQGTCLYQLEFFDGGIRVGTGFVVAGEGH